MKQTAVEWLLSHIQQKLYIKDGIIEQALEMEKEQIIDAYGVGYLTDFKLNSDYTTQTPEQYYNQTFKA